MGSHNPPPFEAQRPSWHTARCPPPFGAQRPCSHTAWCPLPFGTQRPCWHTARCLTLFRKRFPHPYKECFVPLSKPTASRCCPLWAFPFGFSLKVFKMCLLGRGFHTLTKNVLFSSPTDVTSHRRPNFGACRWKTLVGLLPSQPWTRDMWQLSTWIWIAPQR